MKKKNLKKMNEGLRSMVIKHCRQNNFSIQTIHRTFYLYSNFNTELWCQDREICIAALYISQKFHETNHIQINQLCSILGVKREIILNLQIQLLSYFRFKIAEQLLLNECLQIAYQWDSFIKGITCINVRFFKPSLVQIHASKLSSKVDEEKENSIIYSNSFFSKASQQQLRQSNFTEEVMPYGQAQKLLVQICTKLLFRGRCTKNFELSLAIVIFCIKQSESYGKIEKFIKKGTLKSTDFIINDFVMTMFCLTQAQILKLSKYKQKIRCLMKPTQSRKVFDHINANDLKKRAGSLRKIL